MIASGQSQPIGQEPCCRVRARGEEKDGEGYDLLGGQGLVVRLALADEKDDHIGPRVLAALIGHLVEKRARPAPGGGQLLVIDRLGADLVVRRSTQWRNPTVSASGTAIRSTMA